jgi:Trp operon repressor
MSTLVVGRIDFAPRQEVIPPSRNTKMSDREVLAKYDFEIAHIVCGHNFIQEWPEDKQAEFEAFVREVLRTVV